MCTAAVDNLTFACKDIAARAVTLYACNQYRSHLAKIQDVPENPVTPPRQLITGAFQQTATKHYQDKGSAAPRRIDVGDRKLSPPGHNAAQRPSQEEGED